MGTMLISSLIIFPAITAKRLVGSFKAMTILAAAVSVICFFMGLCVSFVFSLPTGASVVGVNLIVLLVSRLVPAKN